MRRLITLFVLIIICPLLFAIPANPEPGVISFTDGSELRIYLRGDEFHSWHETEDGHDVMKNASGEFEYVDVLPDGTISTSGIIAHAPEHRDQVEINYIESMPQNIVYPEKMPQYVSNGRRTKMSAPSANSNYTFEQTTFPTLGDVDFLVLMVEFPDKRFRHTQQNFDDLMNGENYTYNGAVGSVNAYFKAASFDRFNPHFEVVGPLMMDNSYAYYGANNEYGGDDFAKIRELVKEAISKADPLVDYSQYDNDNDGYVDNIYIFYAGYSEANVNADENTIWPHRSWLGLNAPILDGKTFYDYSISQELISTTGTTRSSIAVVCHEFSHVLGLWDYYDTDFSGSGGRTLALGFWDIMSDGVYLENGNRPPLHNSWSRMFLKWTEPVELLNPENVIINPTYSHNEARYFHSPTEGEFFFLENRQQQGWDQALYGHGLLVYHIDKNNPGWSDNTINCNPDKEGFDLKEAMGDTNTSYHYADMDPFPGRTNNTSFTDETNPDSKDWANNNSNAPITNIQEINGIISFVFKGANVDSPENVNIESTGFNSIDLSWSLNSNADSVMILWSQDEIISHPQSTETYKINDKISNATVIYKGTDTVFHHLGLDPGTLNNYELYSFNDTSHIYSARVLKSASTESPLLTSSTFDNGLPKGWTSIDLYDHSTFSTENPQARTLASSSSNDGFLVIDCENVNSSDSIKAELISQSYNLELCQSVVVKFQHHLEVQDSTLAQFSYSSNGGLTWTDIQQWTATTENPEFYEVNLRNELSGLNDVRFKFSYTATHDKYWCIDDFEIYAAEKSGLSAAFYSNTIIGYKPLTVDFINSSACNPDSVENYFWDFGDNSDFNTEKEPSYTYAFSGVYNVLLIANKGEESSSCLKSNYIIVLNHAPTLLETAKDTLDAKINQSTTYNLHEFFADPDEDPLTFYCANIPAHINSKIVNDSLLVLTPDNNYTGMANLDLIAVDSDNDSLIHVVDVWVSQTNINTGIPKNFALSQNYPNPFNPITAISYQLPTNEQVKLDVYNLMGQNIQNLVNENQEAGYYTLKFNASNLSSGVYFYRLTAGNNIVTKKMVLMK